MSKVFLDTNVLAYACDFDQPEKRDMAREVMRTHGHGNILWQVSFWDALIISTAQKLRCEILYTEDLNDGQIFDSVKVKNPFA